MKILVIDNYDSFTYNLVELVKKVTDNEIHVVRNDKTDNLDFSQFDKIILSPGPGIPSEAGNLVKIIKSYGDTIPMLGVCLGQQAISEVYGAKLTNLSKVYHGIEDEILVTDEPNVLFKNMGKTFKAGKYHSWIAESNETFVKEFKITAKDNDENIMAVEHKKHPLFGVQFHPESILTPEGIDIISNFINYIK